MPKILIIDDEKLICDFMLDIFKDMDHEVFAESTLSKGLLAAETGDFDVIFLDVHLPDGNGLENLENIRSVSSEPEVIIITGFADADGAELAIEGNAWDYIEKPLTLGPLTLALTRALQYRKEKVAARNNLTLDRKGIIGKSSKITACLDLVAKSAKSVANILISGETGTGKELFARCIHTNSMRGEKNFVVVDCGSLPESIMESLLFGHQKGSFTGADRTKEGFIKHADGGTLFLDEVGELSLASQKVFLRVLQERRFHPIGGTREIESDFRLIAASNQNIDEMVTQGQFRSDLLFRLRSIHIELPPLRERTEDIEELATHYIEVLCDAHDVGLKEFSPEFFEVLTSYNWPGNVRELYSCLDWTIAQALNEPLLFARHLPPRIRIHVARSSFDQPTPEKKVERIEKNDLTTVSKWRDYRKSILDESESKYLRDLVSQTNGNIKLAVKLSGLSQPRLYELLRKHNIPTK